MLKSLLKDPLTVFLIMGAAIFLTYHWLNDDVAEGRNSLIIVTDSDIDRLSELYARTWQSEPDSAALRGILDEYINSEILYKESLKIGLDHNDEIIKRRLVQKYEFLIKDLANILEPTSGQLSAYFDGHQQYYKSPKQVSFHHYYFSPDQIGDPEKRVTEALKKWSNAQSAPDKSKLLSNPIHIPNPLINQTEELLLPDFGTDFTSEVLKCDSLGWCGPLRSGIGWHLVWIDRIDLEEQLSYEQAMEQLKSDWRTDQLAHYNETIIESIKSSYRVKLDINKWKKLAQ